MRRHHLLLLCISSSILAAAADTSNNDLQTCLNQPEVSIPEYFTYPENRKRMLVEISDGMKLIFKLLDTVPTWAPWLRSWYYNEQLRSESDCFDLRKLLICIYNQGNAVPSDESEWEEALQSFHDLYHRECSKQTGSVILLGSPSTSTFVKPTNNLYSLPLPVADIQNQGASPTLRGSSDSTDEESNEDLQATEAQNFGANDPTVQKEHPKQIIKLETDTLVSNAQEGESAEERTSSAASAFKLDNILLYMVFALGATITQAILCITRALRDQ